MPGEMIVGKIEFAPVALDTHSAGMYAELERLRISLREVLEICRHWEPDCASGKDRNTLARAQSLLPPNV